jgi:hypothetical protein
MLIATPWLLARAASVSPIALELFDPRSYLMTSPADATARKEPTIKKGITHAVIDDLVRSRARQRHDDGQCARTEYPNSDIGLEPTPPEVIAALRAEIAAFDASVKETDNG